MYVHTYTTCISNKMLDDQFLLLNRIVYLLRFCLFVNFVSTLIFQHGIVSEKTIFFERKKNQKKKVSCQSFYIIEIWTILRPRTSVVSVPSRNNFLRLLTVRMCTTHLHCIIKHLTSS